MQNDFQEETKAANDRVYRADVPELGKDNMFLNEYKFIKAPFNKVSQKYNILYQVLAPKLMAKPNLINSKVQHDAHMVLKVLISNEKDKPQCFKEMMPTGDILPLK